MTHQTTHIVRVLAVPAVGAYYYDDLAALQSNAMPLAERYAAVPVTPGFQRVREVAEAVSIGLVLNDGQVAWGDCVAVEFRGNGGRDPVFRAEEGLATIRRTIAPMLQDREVASFRELAAEVDALTEFVKVNRPAPPPVVRRSRVGHAPCPAADRPPGDEVEPPAGPSHMFAQG